MAAGKIRGDEIWLQTHFKKNGWILWGPELIRSELRTLRDAGYENSVAAIVTKLLPRDAKRVKTSPLTLDAAV